MKVLIVARCKQGRYAPFINEQVEALERQEIDCSYFGIDKKGVFGYLRLFPSFLKACLKTHPDVIHAHYGFCGVLANWQRKVPVVTTYHGSDINNPKVLFFSRIKNNYFFLSQSQKLVNNFTLIPGGINLEDYPIIGKIEARHEMGLAQGKKYVLFSGAFDNPVKNAPLAKAAMALIPEAELLELKDYSRPQVATLMQAADILLMTSFTEGSPQVIKEAMACGCPIVSVDVGDVRERIEGIDGCYIAERNVQSIAENIQSAFTFQGRTKGRDSLKAAGLTNKQIASEIIKVYHGLTK